MYTAYLCIYICKCGMVQIHSCVKPDRDKNRKPVFYHSNSEDVNIVRRLFTKVNTDVFILRLNKCEKENGDRSNLGSVQLCR